ncbi:MAG: class I SAM-dependent methyltransferase [Candidatus Pacebacteria bacterium]|nr:class I SAM-dependent methyltransferase [Candidatus Paceibacterota bacterium]
MKAKNIQLYKSTNAYLKAPEGMKNEMLMWYVGGGVLMQELAKRADNKPYGGLRHKIGYLENQKLKTIEILDVCSGLGNFVNHLSFIYPKIKATCIDINKVFLKYDKTKFKNWKFIEADAATFSLNRKFDFITASSAYHHIKNKDKLAFLKNLKNHLKKGGVIIVCENFLPDYKTEKERGAAVRLYYKELKDFYKKGNSTKDSFNTIVEVEHLEVVGKEEYKVSFKFFSEQIKKAGLVVYIDIPIWQPKGFIKDNAGSHVIILK